MKAKKILLILLSALFFSFSAFSVISCDEGTSNNENISNSDSSFSEIFSSSEDKSESITQSDSSSEEEPHIHEWIVDEIILEATCTTKGAAIYKCETCTETKNEVINALGHTEVIDQEVKPTCETTGLTQGSHCEICNEILVKQEKIDKVDHNYIEQVLTAATCLSDGVTLFTCSECKDVEYEITTAFGHTEVIDQEVKPTCTETGLTQGAHCETCNEVLTKQEVVEALGHSYTSVVTNPTCEEQGYTTHTCENCNDSYIDTYTNALGHSYSSEYYSDETHHWKECSTCEEKDSVEAHIPNIESVTEEDDKVCTVCNYLIDQALGHIHDMEYISAKNATCTEKGNIEYYYCEGCNSYFADEEGNKKIFNITINELSHNYQVSSHKDATCTEEGYTTYVCSNDTTHTYTDIHTAIGHNYSSVVTNPTCEAQGYTTQTCSNCNDTYIDSYTNALGHDYQISDHKDVSCTEDGHTTYVCNNDSTHTYTDVHEAIGHNYKSVVTNPTCEEQGYTTHTCSNCNDTYVDSYTNALGHSYEEDYAYDETYHWQTSLCGHNVVNNYEKHDLIDGYCQKCSYKEEQEHYTDGLVFVYNDYYMGYCVNDYTGTNNNVVIPSTYNGLPVTSIGDFAFYYCSSLTTITIPESVTSIGVGALRECSSLTSVTIPNSVTSIGSWAFFGCSSLERIVVDDDNRYYDSRNDCNAIIETSTNTLLFGCKNTTIPESVTSIGVGAFYGCSSLESITIPDIVTSIGDSAFYNCSSLESITIPDIVTSIGSYAFYNCSSLESITIPDRVTSIGSYAFYKCTSLTSITIPDRVTSIGDSAFYNCSSLTSIEIPNSVTSIGYQAFHGCSSLISVTIGNSVTIIEGDAFNSCSSLDSIVVDSNNKVYDSRNNCNAIIETSTNTLIVGCKNTIIPDTVVNIGDRSFYNCSSLTSITIPESVTSIGNQAFSYCSSLLCVIIPNSVTYIGIYAFQSCTSLTSITIPNSVTSIAPGAFAICTSLTSIIIPDSVTSIGNETFCKCSSLTSVTIGKSVTSIGYAAFQNCVSLTSIEIPDSVISIGESAFSYCSSLESITISDSVTTIEYRAFYNCSSLESITIPDSVTSIGNSAFYDCDSLTDVYYEGTEEQWNNISIGTRNECLTNATIHFAEEEIEICPIKNIYEMSLSDRYTVPVKNVKGVISFIYVPGGIYSNDVYIKDENGDAIMIYDNTFLLDQYSVGDTIIVDGDVILYNGYPEIKDVTKVIKVEGDGEISLDSPIEITKDNVNEEWVVDNNYQIAKIISAKVAEINPRGASIVMLGDTQLILYQTAFPENIKVGDYVDVNCIIFSYFDIVEGRTSSTDDITLNIVICDHELTNVCKTYGNKLSAIGDCINCEREVTIEFDEETSNMIKTLKDNTDWAFYSEVLESGIVYEHYYNYDTNYSYIRYINNGRVVEEYLTNETETIYYNAIDEYYYYGLDETYVDYWWAYPILVADLLYENFYCFTLDTEVLLNISDLNYFTTYNKNVVEEYWGASVEEFWEIDVPEEFYYTIGFKYTDSIISFPVTILSTTEEPRVGHFGIEREFYSQDYFEENFGNIIDSYDRLYEYLENRN